MPACRHCGRRSRLTRISVTVLLFVGPGAYLTGINTPNQPPQERFWVPGSQGTSSYLSWFSTFTSRISNMHNIAQVPLLEGVGNAWRSGSALDVFTVCFTHGSRDTCHQRRGWAHLCVCHSRQSSMESPNLEFEYGDTDVLTAELSGTSDRPKRGFSRTSVFFGGVC